MDLIKERYEEERTKRLCSNGNTQYIETSKLVEFEQFMIDHWVDSASVKPILSSLARPKLPGVPGILDYRGDIFHTSRWAYDITGESPKDPKLPTEIAGYTESRLKSTHPDNTKFGRGSTRKSMAQPWQRN
ncbi:hypothetical protein N7533_003674 [Penicillium manginii]|uniref:uncharacterized protein n=1 Tax=Penicillium manginii TaxID=203109 RepID=UPI0025472276|nr:uncharacterized protein N7533_003674 [Penicillium manginii]KAJ5761635.1 hypothetical protein N7533_003674 [Penicillium manginii]